MGVIIASLKNPYMVATIVFTIMVLGIVAMVTIPIDILPAMNVKAIRTMAFNQGMGAEMIDKTMTGTVARYQSSALAAQRVLARSTNGVCMVTTFFQDGSDLGTDMAQSSALANSSLARLPPNTLQPISIPFNPTATQPLLIIGVTSGSLSETKLKDLTIASIRAQIGAVTGAQAMGTFGGKDRAVMVYVDKRRLEARGLSQLDVVQSLSQNNFLLALGAAKFGDNEVQLDSNALARPITDLNEFPLRLDPTNTVYLRDVGRAEDSFNVQTSMVRIAGQRTVYTPVFAQTGASSVSVVNGVRAALPTIMDNIKSETGYDVELHPVMDQTFYVRESLESLIHEGVIGAGLVSLMILLFLGNFRMTLIACLSIPLAVLGAITGLWLTGNTLNIMSLSGLALAIGPLVDDAVVELENNHRHYEMGKSRIRAAIDGAREVILPVVVATSTTILVLSPIALMPGLNGQLFRPLALSVTFAMLTSFGLSRTFVPMLCARFLPDAHVPTVGHELVAAPRLSIFGRIHHRFEAMLVGVNRFYERLLAITLRFRLLVLLAVLALFAASLLQTRWIGQEFFPPSDAGQLVIYARAPSGTNIEANERRIVQLEAFIKEQIPPHDLQLLISEIGVDTDYSAAYTVNAATWDATLRVQLSAERTRSAQDYAALLRRLLHDDPRYADMRFSFNTGGMIQSTLDFGAPSPIDVRVSGGTDLEAYTVAQAVRDRLATVAGACDVRVDQRLDAPQKIIEVDRQKAASLGLSEYDVVTQVVAAMNSSQAVKRIIWIDQKSGQQYWVAVQYPQDRDIRIGDMLDIVATAAGSTGPVKLSSLVHVREGSVPVQIDHDQFARVYNVLVNIDNRDVGSVVGDIQRELERMQQEKLIPERVRVRVTGEYSSMVDSFRTLSLGLALASLFVYFLLVALFRTFLGPFIIMFTVPMGLIGVLTTLHLTGTTLNVESGMGVIFLVGIAVSNGVLLVDFANHRRKEGRSVHEAITEAAGTRFRPIVMTFLATFLDLLPMALGSSLKSSTVPLARAVVGGMLTSTVLTLFVVPMLYTLLLRDRPIRDLDAEVEEEMNRPFKPVEPLPHPSA